MMTHRDKKPYECKFCDKSYCDHRSLKRHYENFHPNPERLQPVATSLQKTDAESLRTAKPEGRFTPDRDEGRRSPLSSRQEGGPHSGYRRKRNSDSIGSNNSDDLSKRSDSHSPHVVFDKPHTAVSMLKQVFDSHELKKDKHPMEGYSLSTYYPYPEGFNPQQWFNPFHQTRVMKFVQFNQPPILVQHGHIPQMNHYCPNDPPQLVPNYPQMNQQNPSEGTQEDSSRKKGEDNGYKGNKDFVVPTDATSIAISNAKDEQSGDHVRHVQFKDLNEGGFPRVVQWKTVSTCFIDEQL